MAKRKADYLDDLTTVKQISRDQAARILRLWRKQHNIKSRKDVAPALRQYNAEAHGAALFTNRKRMNPIRRGPNPRGKVPPHLKKYLFKKGRR